jgi:putative tryptophan/tyrosine transport system substrate-binding protein
MLNRRSLLTLSASSLVAVPSGAPAQTKVYKVGLLVNQGATINGKPNPQVETFYQGLKQLGYVEGSNLVVDARYPEGRSERLPGFAAELVAGGVDVIAAFGGLAVNAARIQRRRSRSCSPSSQTR